MTEQSPLSGNNISGPMGKAESNIFPNSPEGLASVYKTSFQLQKDYSRLIDLAQRTQEFQRVLLERLPYIGNLDMDNTTIPGFIGEPDLRSGTIIVEKGNDGKVKFIYAVGRKPKGERPTTDMIGDEIRDTETEFVIFQHNDPQNAWKLWYGAITKEEIDLDQLVVGEEQDFDLWTQIAPTQDIILDLGGKALYLGAYSLVKNHARGERGPMQEAEKTVAYLEKLIETA